MRTAKQVWTTLTKRNEKKLLAEWEATQSRNQESEEVSDPLKTEVPRSQDTSAHMPQAAAPPAMLHVKHDEPKDVLTNLKVKN
jgi:hypothetical protein